MSTWQTVDNAPEGVLLATKIDDADGERNHALLKRRGGLWFVPDGSIYVYYRPTHFRMPTSEEREREAGQIRSAAKALLKKADALDPYGRSTS